MVPRNTLQHNIGGKMSDHTTDIRNIAIVGHGGTGKTTLVENILFRGGEIPKAEKVETGRTVTDFTSEEITRGGSIHASLAHVHWKNTKINLFDTPGAGDFVGEVVTSFRSSESAVILVGARSGVQIETIKLWRRLNDRKKPRMAFINKVDKSGTDYFKTIEDLKEKFKVVFIPVTIPIGHDTGFKGVINLLDMTAHYYDPDGGQESIKEIPDDMKEEAEKYRLILMEEAAEGDEELLEKYVSEGSLNDDEIKLGLREGLETNTFVPVFCGASLMGAGITALMDFVAYDSPSPFRVEEPCVSGEKSKIISPDGAFSGHVFKTTVDQFNGKLSFLKVITGKLNSSAEAYNPRTQNKERINKIFVIQGKSLKEVAEVEAGDIAVLNKIDDLETNDTLCSSSDVIHYKSFNFPQPVHSLAISAKEQKEEDKLGQLMHRLSMEDPTFHVKYNPETKQTVVSAMGELHMNIVLDKIRELGKIEVITKPPRVAYRETITKPAAAEYTHKKQTGGHGQYGKVMMEIKPSGEGQGFSFTDTIKGGAISKGYFPGIEKGVLEAMEEGILAGYPIVDVSVNISDGKEHPVDSSEMAFKLAGKGAFKACFDLAKPKMLEPVMKLSVIVEEKYMGDILADLSSKRGQILGQEMLGGNLVEIDAHVPQSELIQYSMQLKSITSNTGVFEMEFSHYSPLNPKDAQRLAEEHQTEKTH
jgi:elongation factor G